MAVADKWDKVYEAFDRLEHYRKLHPTLAALRRLVDLVKHDAAFADVHPQVSMVSLIFSRVSAKQGVYVGWKDDGGYDVALVDRQMDFSEATTAREDDVVQKLREYPKKLGDV